MASSLHRVYVAKVITLPIHICIVDHRRLRTNRIRRSLRCWKIHSSVSSLGAEILRRSICHVGVAGYHAHVTGSAAIYHALSTLPPVVWLAGMLTLAGTVYEISKGAYQLLLYWGASRQWETLEEEEPLVLYGVDLSRSSFFQRESVRKAVEFAARAHQLQKRRTGEPYVVHCIETALIVESNLGQLEDDARAEAAVVAALLHDVLDDTSVELNELQAEFGERVADMVKKVSILNQANQLIRRRKRQGLLRNSAEEEAALFGELKNMILTMVAAEPLVVLVKLADRLHNMRTVYVLKPDKQHSVADETLEVWCSMAERLGWDALKCEMEDLCFAVLEPELYTLLRSKLYELWGLHADLEPDPDNTAQQTGPANTQISSSPSLPFPLSLFFPSGIPFLNPSPPSTPSNMSELSHPPQHAQPAGSLPLSPLASAAVAATAPAADALAALDVAHAATTSITAATAPVQALLVPPSMPYRAAAIPATAAAVAESSAAAAGFEAANTTRVITPTCVVETKAPQGGQAAAGLLGPQLSAKKGSSKGFPAQRASGAGVPVQGALDQGMGVRFPKGEAPRAVLGSVTVDSMDEEEEGRARGRGSVDLDVPLEDELEREARVWRAAAAAMQVRRLSHSLASTSSRVTTTSLLISERSASYGTRSEAIAPRNVPQPSQSSCMQPSAGGGATATVLMADPCATASIAPATDTATRDFVRHSAPSATTTDNLDLSRPSGAPSIGPPLGSPVLKPSSVSLPALAAAAAVTAKAAQLAADPRSSPAPTPPPFPFPRSSRPRSPTYLYVTSTHDVVMKQAPLPKPGQRTAYSTALNLSSAASKQLIGHHKVDGSSEACPLPAPGPPALTPQQRRLKALLSSVSSFDLSRFSDHAQVPQVQGLRPLDAAANELLYRIRAGSYSAGLAITVQGRLKSIRSVHLKMQQKALSVEEVYDARGLRVIVDDEQGAREHEAMYVCYRVEQTVRGMYKLIPSQYDDYIANPKPSGYRALHMAVKGPDGRPMEVQIKSGLMHQHAEFGGAAHWAYKEQVPLPRLVTNPSQANKGPYVGQPLIQVDFSGYNGKFRYGVVVGLDPAASSPRALLAAIRCGGTLPEYPFWAPISFYQDLHKYTTSNFLSKGLRNPGNGDLKVVLEEYVKCSDGRYHRLDQFGKVQRYCTVALKRITALDLGERNSGLGFVPHNWRQLLQKETEGDPDRARLVRKRQQAFMKTQMARRRLQGRGAATPPPSTEEEEEQLELLQGDEVAVLIWPDGKIVYFPRGTTAGAVVKQKGILEIETSEDVGSAVRNNLVNVNNQLVPESTRLEDGDLLILSREKLKI